MIDEQLKQALIDIKTYHNKSAALKDLATKKQNDQAFSDSVNGMVLSLNKLKQASAIKFKPDDWVLDTIDETLTDLEQTVEYGEVDEEQLGKATVKTRRINNELKKEWNGFHQRSMTVHSGKLNLVSNLSADKTKTDLINIRLNQAANWDNLQVISTNGKSIFANFTDSIDSLQQIEDDLHLSPGIRAFLTKVSRGTAGIDDITDEVKDWIKTQKLEKMFSVKYS